MKSYDEKIYIGQGVRVRGTFRDQKTGNKIDPGTVSVIFLRPDGTETSVVVERAELGEYSGRTVVNQSGRWHWRMVSEEPGNAAKEGSFVVERSMFAVPVGG